MKSRTLTLQTGLNVHYLIAGDRGAPPVVLLHGYPSNCYLWRHCLPELAKRFYVIVPDLPGHGRTDKPLDQSYDLDFFVSFLKAFYDALKIERADLVAHDLGGMAALGFVSRFPEMTRRFVIMDTMPFVKWPIIFRSLMGYLKNPFFAWLSLFRSQFKFSLKHFAVYQKGAVTDEMVDLYFKPWVENRNSRKVYRKVIMAPPEKIIEPIENVRKIQHPTLILWGDKDRIFPIRIAQRLKTDIPNSELTIVPDCGHFLPEEQPKIVTKHMLEFLDR